MTATQDRWYGKPHAVWLRLTDSTLATLREKQAAAATARDATEGVPGKEREHTRLAASVQVIAKNIKLVEAQADELAQRTK